MRDLYSKLDNEKLLQTARDLAKKERAAMSGLLACLEEIDRRRLYAKVGYTSLFDFCVRELGCSESASGRRVAAVRASRKVPELITYLENGELTLEAASAIAPLIAANPPEGLRIIEAVKNKPLREVERIVADRNPQSDVRDTIRPLGNGRYLISFCAGEELREMLERLRDLLRHKFPDGRFEDVLEHAVSEYLARRDPALKRAARRPQEFEGARSGRIPQWVRDEVFKRDGGRCVWPKSDGSRCGATGWLELDHAVPRALGGTNEPANLRLLCRAHNQWSARALGLMRPEGRP